MNGDNTASSLFLPERKFPLGNGRYGGIHLQRRRNEGQEGKQQLPLQKEGFSAHANPAAPSEIIL